MSRARSLLPLLVAAVLVMGEPVVLDHFYRWPGAAAHYLPGAAAQGTDKLTARLGWVPISGAERANVTGKGLATAALSGSTLTITGTFDGLVAPATVVRLHRGIAKAARGPAIADLTVTKAASGTISGTAKLSPEDVEGFRQGKFYLQLHSEKGVAPDGANLWGWFLR